MSWTPSRRIGFPVHVRRLHERIIRKMLGALRRTRATSDEGRVSYAGVFALTMTDCRGHVHGSGGFAFRRRLRLMQD